MTGTRFDLVVRGGRVIDPGNNLDATLDVGFRDGRVAELDAEIPPHVAKADLAAHGLILSPGLIDTHGHFYLGGHPSAVDPTTKCLESGVTTAVDGGTAGWANFPAFRDGVIATSPVRVLAYVHLSTVGLLPVAAGIGRVGELFDIQLAMVDKTIATIKENPATVVGVKVRITTDAMQAEHASEALDMARAVADGARCRLMVHISGSPLPLDAILRKMNRGDVVTHTFHGTANGILESDGSLKQAVIDARNGGVLFDVGHAGIPGSHFDYEIASQAGGQSFWPDTFGTDIHNPRPGTTTPTILEVMSTFSSLGMPTTDIIASATSRAAAAIGRGDKLGSLGVGSVGDAALLAIDDSGGTAQFRNMATIVGGEVLWRAGGSA